jgi:hypothetical protein
MTATRRVEEETGGKEPKSLAALNRIIKASLR